MIQVSAAQLLSLPAGVKKNGLMKLPWPNGSLIPATLSPTHNPKEVMLSLAGYRMKIPMQQALVMGQGWVLLLQRDAPLQLRFLNEADAMQHLLHVLMKKQGKNSSLNEVKGTLQDVAQGWHKLEQSSQPFAMHWGMSGSTVILEDEHNGAARGMVRKQKLEHGFLLHGRVDLTHLGVVVFALHGVHERWHMHMYSASAQGAHGLRERFEPWLVSHDVPMDTVVLCGTVYQGLPDDFTFLSNVKI